MMVECISGPHGCGLWAWIYDYQTLTAGLLAILAAAVAILGTWLERRRRQILLVDALTIEITNRGVALAAAVVTCKRARAKKDLVWLEAVEIPKLERRCASAEALVQEVHLPLREIKAYTMARLRMAINVLDIETSNCRDFALILRSELTGGPMALKDDSSLDEVVNSLRTIHEQAEKTAIKPPVRIWQLEWWRRLLRGQAAPRSH